MFRDQPGRHPDIHLYPPPEGVRDITIPQSTLERRILNGYYRFLVEFLVKDPNAAEEVRRIAETAAVSRRPMDVLEVGNAAPFKSLFFHGSALRSAGDYLIYGPHGAHEKPEIRSTIMADQDYVGRILENPDVLSNPNHRYRILDEELQGILGTNVRYEYGKSIDEIVGSLQIPLQAAYEEKKNRGEITLRLGADPLIELREAYLEGKRYDVIFPDIAGNADRMNYLQLVQASLKEGGRAFVPVTWWAAAGYDFHHGTSQITYLDDTVTTNHGVVPFENYLAEQFPKAYSINDAAGIKVLVVQGTKPPVQLPEFEATPMKSSATGVSLRWKVKASGR